MSIISRYLPKLGLAVALVAVASPVRADFMFEKIADSATSGPFSTTLGQSGVAINNHGTVAFRSGLRAGNSGVFTSSGGVLTTIAMTGPTGLFSSFSTGVAINDSGRVAFRANGQLPGSGSGIFTGDGGIPTVIVRTAGPSNPLNVLGVFPSINNAGQVAFQSTLDNGGSGIFVGDGTTLTTIASTADSFLAFRNAPTINNAGTVAFYGETSTAYGIFTRTGGQTTPLVLGGTTFLGLQDPTINDLGEVAFSAVDSAQAHGVWKTVGGVPVRIHDRFADATSIAFNNSGVVAFLGDALSNQAALYIHDGSLTRRVIGVGDMLDGSAVSSLLFNRNGLNDRGSLAFQARLADGRSTIFRTKPVPEPTSFVLLGIGGVIALSLVRRRRRD